MTGWIKTTLGELCVVTMGQSPPSSTYNTDKNGLPFFQGKAEFSDLYPVTQKWCSKTKKEAEEGNILISVRAPVGDVNIANQHCCIGRGLAAIKYDACPRFIFYFLKHSKDELEKLSTGTTFKAISKQTILNYSLFIPSLVLQHRIVAKIEELFSELDNGIESLKKAREQLKTYRQAVLKYAFEGKLTKEWRNLQRQAGNPPEPAEKLLEQIKTERKKHYQKQSEDWKMACELAKTEGKKKPVKPKKPNELPPLTDAELKGLPGLPAGWCWEKFGNLVSEICLGKMLDKEKNKGEYQPYLRNINVRWNYFDSSDLLKMRFESNENERYGLKEGDLIICEGGEPGRAAIWKEQIPDMKIQKALHRVRFFKNTIINKYALNFIYYSSFNGHLYKFFTGTTIKHLTGKGLSDFIIPVLNYNEQQAIVQEIESRLSVCDQLEKIMEDSLNKAEALRQSILKKAFAGELTRVWREKNPELITGENSAEELLEKIKAEKALANARKNPRSKKTKKK